MSTLFPLLLPGEEVGEQGDSVGGGGDVKSAVGEEVDSSRETLLVTGLTRELDD